MATITYKVEFYSDWICSSGLTGENDDLPILDQNELPFIPGKTLKGLLREGAYYLNNFSHDKNDEMIDKLFGSDKEQGACYFSNAYLSHKMQKVLQKEKRNELLFRDISSTELDDFGQAKEHSLRTIRVIVPLTLFAEIENVSKEYIQEINRIFKWVKNIGCLRNRGFGRCKLEEIENV